MRPSFYSDISFISSNFDVSLCCGKPNPDGACVGTMLFLQSREMEVECAVSRDDYLSGRIFGRGGGRTQDDLVPQKSASTSKLTKKFVPLRPVTNNAPFQRPQAASGSSSNHRQGIQLEPVDLINSSVKSNKATSASESVHWTAHW